MDYKYRRFCRNAQKIHDEFKSIMESNEKYQSVCARYVITDIERGDYSKAYNNTIIMESDKLRNTPFGDILRKYKIYETYHSKEDIVKSHRKFYRRLKYERTYKFYKLKRR